MGVYLTQREPPSVMRADRVSPFQLQAGGIGQADVRHGLRPEAAQPGYLMKPREWRALGRRTPVAG